MSDFDKSKLNTGMPFNNTDADPNVAIDKLIETVNSLSSSLQNLTLNSGSSNPPPLDSSLSPTPLTSYFSGFQTTRDAHVLTPEMQSLITQHFDQIKSSLENHSSNLNNIYNSFLGSQHPLQSEHKTTKPKKGNSSLGKKSWLEKLLLELKGEVTKQTSFINHSVHSQFSKTLHAGHIESHVVNEIGNDLTKTVDSFSNLGSSVLKLSSAFQTLLPILGSLSLGVIGTGVVSALEVINIDEKYKTMMIQANPEEFGSLTSSMGNKLNFQQDLIQNLIGVTKEEDGANLYNLALKTRISGNDLTNENIAGEIGFLDDLGVNKNTSSSTLMSLHQNFGLSAGESMGTLAGLTKTGIDSYTPDINNYISQVMKISGSFSGMGVTIRDVDSTFNKFTKKTFTGGVKVSSDIALNLTELQLGIQKRISTATAGMIGLFQGSNLNVESSLGLHGGQNIGEMMKSGNPLMTVVATQMIKQGANIPHLYDSIAGHYQGLLNMSAPNASHDEKMARLYMMLSKEGVISGDFSDLSVRALLDEIITHKKGSDNLRKKFEKISPKPLTELFTELKNKILKPELKSYFGSVEQFSSPLESLGKVWSNIKQLLAGFFLPAVEFSAIFMGSIGSFASEFFKTHDIFKAGRAFSSSYDSLRENFSQTNQTGTLKSLIEHNEISKQFLIRLGLYGADPNKQFTKKLKSAMDESFNLGKMMNIVPYGQAQITPSTTSLSSSLPKSQYVEYAREVARKNGIPEELFLAQINQESGFNPNARSAAGAVGIAQIIPKFHPNVNPYDAKASLRYMGNWMNKLHSKYKKQGYDDVTAYALALSAYNAGEGNVAKYGTSIYQGRLAETTNYKNKILSGREHLLRNALMSNNYKHHASSPDGKIISTTNVHVKNKYGKVIKTQKTVSVS